MKAEEFDREVEKVLKGFRVTDRQAFLGSLEYWRVCAIADALLGELYKTYGRNRQRAQRKAEAIQEQLYGEFAKALPGILRASRGKGLEEVDIQFKQLYSRLKLFTDLRRKRSRTDPETLLYWYDYALQCLKRCPRKDSKFCVSDLEKAFPNISPEQFAEWTHLPPSELAEMWVAEKFSLSNDTLHFKILPKARKLQRERLCHIDLP